VVEKILWKLLTWKKPSIVFLLCGMFRDNERATMRSDKERFAIVADHLQSWIYPMRALAAKYPLRSWGMVAYTFGQLFADLMLAVSSIVGGAYSNAARTMRSVLESMVHAAYVQERFPWYPELIYDVAQEALDEETFNQRVKERLMNEVGLSREEQERITGFKFGMIGDLQFLTKEKKNGLFKIYSQLSELVHPTPLRLRKHMEDAFFGVTFSFDGVLFGRCADLLDGTMDLVLSVLLTSCPEIGPDLKNQKYLFQSLARLPISSRLLV
jgi:hypothetical protein